MAVALHFESACAFGRAAPGGNIDWTQPKALGAYFSGSIRPASPTRNPPPP